MQRIKDYYYELLDNISQNSWVIHKEINFREIDEKEGYIKGTLYLYGGFLLHIAEYVTITSGYPKYDKYRYHLVDSKNKFIARWDNAPHHIEIHTYPYHKHCEDEKIEPSPEMNLLELLPELDEVLSPFI